MKLSTFFELQEFLPERFYLNLMKWHDVATFIRITTQKPVIINNWHVGGRFNERGFRMPDSSTGAPGSQHRMMNAIDINIGNWEVTKMFDFVENYAFQLYRLGVRRVEHPSETPGWLHLDGKEHGKNGIQVIGKNKIYGIIPLKNE